MSSRDKVKESAFLHNTRILGSARSEYVSSLQQELAEMLKKNDGIDGLEEAHNRLKQEALSKLQKADILGTNMKTLQEQLSKMIDICYKNFFVDVLSIPREEEVPEAAAEESEVQLATKSEKEYPKTLESNVGVNAPEVTQESLEQASSSEQEETTLKGKNTEDIQQQPPLEYPKTLESNVGVNTPEVAQESLEQTSSSQQEETTLKGKNTWAIQQQPLQEPLKTLESNAGVNTPEVAQESLEQTSSSEQEETTLKGKNTWAIQQQPPQEDPETLESTACQNTPEAAQESLEQISLSEVGETTLKGKNTEDIQQLPPNAIELDADTAILEHIVIQYKTALWDEVPTFWDSKGSLAKLEVAHKRLKKEAKSKLKEAALNEKKKKTLKKELSNMIGSSYSDCHKALSTVSMGTQDSYLRCAERFIATWISTIIEMVTPSKPQPLHVLVPSPSKVNTYELKREVFESRMWKDVADLPVVVISVAGVFRTGKSFLLGYLVRYLEHIETHRSPENWMGHPDKPVEAFSWKYGRKKHTSGVLLWEKIFEVNTASGIVAVVLMDTEGSSDNTSTLAANTALFSLTMLLSSTLIYNIMKNLNQTIVENLQFCANYASVMKKNLEAQKKDQGYDAFQRLLFLVRDWDCKEEIPYGLDVERKIIKEWLHHDEEAEDSVNEMRANVTENIRDINCFLMPYPGQHVTTATFDGRSSDLSEEFRQSLDKFVRFLFSSRNLAAKRVNGRKFTCKDFTILFKAYFMICKDGKLPEVRSVYNVTAYVHNNNVLQSIQMKYASSFERDMSKILENKRALVTLETEHRRRKAECLSELDNAPIMGKNTEAIQEQLSQMIDAYYAGIKGAFQQGLKANELAWLRAQREEQYLAELEKAKALAESSKILEDIEKSYNSALQDEVAKIKESKVGVDALEVAHKRLKQAALSNLQKVPRRGNNTEAFQEDLSNRIECGYTTWSMTLRRSIMDAEIAQLAAEREAQMKAYWEKKNALAHNNSILSGIEKEYASALHEEFTKIMESKGRVDALDATHKRLKQKALSKLQRASLKDDNTEDFQKELSNMIDLSYTSSSVVLRKALIEKEDAKAEQAQLEAETEKKERAAIEEKIEKENHEHALEKEAQRKQFEKELDEQIELKQKEILQSATEHRQQLDERIREMEQEKEEILTKMEAQRKQYEEKIRKQEELRQKELQEMEAQRAEFEAEEDHLDQKPGERLEEYKKRIRDIYIKCMERQGVDLDEDAKKKLADDLGSDASFLSSIIEAITYFFRKFFR